MAEQLHFHWGSRNKQGSEHLCNGKAYPMEVGRIKKITYLYCMFILAIVCFMFHCCLILLYMYKVLKKQEKDMTQIIYCQQPSIHVTIEYTVSAYGCHNRVIRLLYIILFSLLRSVLSSICISYKIKLCLYYETHFILDAHSNTLKTVQKRC